MNYTGVCKQVIDDQLRAIQATPAHERGYMIGELLEMVKAAKRIEAWRKTLPDNGSDCS